MQLPLSTIPNFSCDGRWLGLAWVGEGQFELLEVAPSPEYRTLVSSEGADRGAYYYGAISPDGRLLALGMAQGTRLWDLRSGREVATLPGFAEFAYFDRSGQALGLLTCGDKGLNRWPIDGADPTGRLRFGPPVHLSARMNAGFTRTTDGHTLVGLSGADGALEILDLQTGGASRKLGTHPAAQKMALSRNGQWVASSGWHSDRVRLWNAQTGTMVHEWVLGRQTDIFFTPDSRALIIARGDALSFWDVESLQLIRRIPCEVALYPSYVAFSPDGKLMAMELAPAVIHLKEVATGLTVARLEDPHGDRANWLSFTPDGTQLVVEARYARAVHVWDLRAIRTRLKSMALDWDWPEFQPWRPRD
jgi:WD40 repeat protein